jgi:hypothetical protein
MTGENSSLEFIRNSIARAINHIVREDPETKGVVRIEPKTDGNFDVFIHRGTQSQAVVIEDVSKERLMSMMEEQL